MVSIATILILSLLTEGPADGAGMWSSSAGFVIGATAVAVVSMLAYAGEYKCVRQQQTETPAPRVRARAADGPLDCGCGDRLPAYLLQPRARDCLALGACTGSVYCTGISVRCECLLLFIAVYCCLLCARQDVFSCGITCRGRTQAAQARGRSGGCGDARAGADREPHAARAGVTPAVAALAGR